MNETALEKLDKAIGIFESSLKVVLLVFVFLLWPLYIFAIPLGLELFLFGGLSTTYSPSSPISITFFNAHIEVSLSFVFTLLLLIYTSCFVLAWKQGKSFHKFIDGFFSEPIILPLKRFLFAMPVLSSLTYVVVVNIHLLQESYGIPTGKPPLPKDPLLAFFELSTTPLTEEIIFRILPIGAFLMVYLLSFGIKRKSLITWKERLKISILALLSPEGAKKMLGLKTVEDSGLRGGISLDEWMMIFFTSAFFAFSHYFFTSTWNVGKITSTFIQGLVMGLSYLIYGIQAPILIHWFFNYYIYTYALAAAVHPSLIILNFLNEKLTSILGILGLLMIICLGVRESAKTSIFTLKTLLYPAEKLKKNFVAKGSKLLIFPRRVDSVFLKGSIFDLSILILTLFVFAVRLTIVNFPKPEVGGRYYDTGFIFDESYYVKAARKLLIGESANNEHPPLSKALIMLGMILLGDNPLGWRISSIIASSISIALLYRLTLFLSKNKAVSFSTALFFATDIMVFNTGQIGTLDAPSMMFVLVASVMFLRKRYDLCGFFFGLAFLCKLSSIFVTAGVILFLLFMRPIERKGFLVKFLKGWVPLIGRILLIGFITLLAGLWIYDAAYKVFNRNPLEHLIFMFNYHNSLKYEDPGDVILPLQWINPLSPFSPVAYYVTTVREISNGGTVREYHPIAYYGMYAPLWWSIWLILPVSLMETIRKSCKSEEQEMDLFVFSWIAANFFPYVVFAYLLQRWVYPFYFYMTLPGLYIGMSYYLSYLRLSKIFLGLLIFIQLFWFFVWFPVKPKSINDLLFFLGLPT